MSSESGRGLSPDETHYCTDPTCNAEVCNDLDHRTSGRVLTADQINQDDGEGLWPRRDSDCRVLHGVAFPDPAFTDGTHTVRYVGTDEKDARSFAAERGGTYVRARQDIEIERTDWEIA